jgi:hypothetical protein
MIDGQKYRGTTKETVKSRANTVEALLIADVRNNGGHVNLRRAPVLRDFSERFLDYVDAQRSRGSWTSTPNVTYQGGWKMLKKRSWLACESDRIGTSDAAVLTFPHSPSNANRAFRTLSRMLRLAVEWNVLRASPRIKLLEEHGRTALIESSTEALLLQHALNLSLT